MYVSQKTLTIMLLATLAFTSVYAADDGKKDDGKKDEGKKDDGKKDDGKKVPKILKLVDPFKEVKKDSTSIQAALKKDWASLTLEQLAAVGTENKDVCKEITLDNLKALEGDKLLAFVAGEGCKDTFMPKEVPAAKKDLCALYKDADDKIHHADFEKQVGAGDQKVREDFFCPAFKQLPAFKEKGDAHFKNLKCNDGNMIKMAAAMLAVPAVLAMMFV